jgi:hypothetical protein
MFEQLSYNESQTEAVVQNILNGSFLAGNYSYNGQVKTYASTFVEAGKKYGVSPVHLAARVLQEQGYILKDTPTKKGDLYVDTDSLEYYRADEKRAKAYVKKKRDNK